MVHCYYREIEEVECEWEGNPEDLARHLVNSHGIFSHSSCKHNKFALELMMDPESYGFRFVVLDFNKISCIFEEYFDEDTELVSVLLRAPERVNYKIKLHGAKSSLEYEGTTQVFEDPSIEDNSNCLQVHEKQLFQFCHLVDNERRYKVILMLKD